jgi:predicted Zn-dependent peptidase
MEFKHRQLENGLAVIGEINPAAQSAAIGFFIRTGSRDETPEISGVSHFLEHMLFKGTEKLSALEVNEAFDRLGAKFNAFTSEENTVYYAAVLPEYLEAVAELWSHLMRPMLRQDDFDMEKQVILEEIAMYLDQPDFLVFDRGRELFFKDHPCGNSVLGSIESITNLTSEQMQGYFNRRYAPNNITLACCGNFDFDRLCRQTERLCGNWMRQQATRSLPPHVGKPQKVYEQKSGLNRQHLALYSPSVSMQDNRWYAAQLLSMILGDNSGSRYFWSLVDPAIADTAILDLASMDEAGALCSYICCGPENVAQVEDILNRLFASLTKEGIEKVELEAARNKVLSSVALKSEQPMGRLVNLGFNWVYRNEYISVAQDIDHIRKVTIGEIHDLINLYNPGNYTLYSLGPA